MQHWFIAAVLFIGQCGYSQAHAQSDALEAPAVMSELAPSTLLLDVRSVGDRLVAVGERGHILMSNDHGQNWSQSQVPVRVTLTASFFANDNKGWAIGHDGVVITTDDGGYNWRKLLDGYQANQLLLDHARKLYANAKRALENASDEERSKRELEFENAEYRLHDAEAFMSEGASRPFLGIWFKNESEGYIVGAFGMFLQTLDGGNSWQPVVERLQNPDGFHLNAIRRIGGQLFIVAEAGGIFRSDDDGKSWTLLASPYEGSFFGISGNEQGLLVVYGLRGHAFFSLDRGDSWQPVATNTDKTILGGTLLKNGQVLLIGYGGSMIVVDKLGNVVSSQNTTSRLPITDAVDMGAEGIVTVGIGGARIHPSQQNAQGVN
ncbi:YCF48-related protein [Marinobacterium maritimum]|uniref:YCF48-related protein n=1 Tax=Marinobacterium maritimum TaxID=500162 RepID=A0ABN1I4U9_9GAMM